MQAMQSHRPLPTTGPSLKKFSVADREILERRVRTNPRYSKVQARTNTGFNTHRRQELDKEIRKYYKVRNDEVFRRISLSDLVQLMVAHAQDTAAAEQEEAETQEEQLEGEEVPLKHRDQLQEVVHGMEGLMASGSRSAPLRPYLIVDVRPPQQYQEGHLATAVSHPAPRLARAVGWECAELLAHKNRTGTIVVVCDEGEEAGPGAVEALQHRGYSNVLLLSGGVRLARDKVGEPLLTADASQTLSLSAALALQAQLDATVLPPLTMADAGQWWAASSPTTAANTARTTPANTARSTAPPPQPRPWR